jgi:putative glycerol-1-phosphate prenyltransferase
MNSVNLYDQLRERRLRGDCGLLILIDPDKFSPGPDNWIERTDPMAFLVGGSVLTIGNVEETIASVRRASSKPIYLFPGSCIQISSKADGILLPSLISGRNPEYLIGQHVQASFAIQRSGMHVFPVGYILCGGTRISSTQYITQSVPLPADKPELVIATALAGIQLGMKAIYLEAGSGQGETVPAELVRVVAEAVDCPILVGGGIRNLQSAQALKAAGATALVIGNILENEPRLIDEFNRI